MRRTTLIGMCFLLTACEARPAHEPVAPQSESAAPPSAPAAPEDAAEAESAAPAPDHTALPAPKRNTAPRAVTPPQSSEPPVEVEGVVIIGPRDGETLGEFRARADTVFHRLDTDGDGRLDREEITSGSARLPFRTALEQGDIDLDQFLSPQEFGDLVTRAFQRLDGDGDGVVTDLEIEAAGDPLAH